MKLFHTIQAQLWLILLFAATAAQAQQSSDPIRVGLLPYTYDYKSIPREYVEAIQSNITSYFEGNKRFSISNKGAFGNSRQSYQREEIMEAGKLQGAQYLIAVNYYKLHHRTFKKKKQITFPTSPKDGPPVEIEISLFVSDVQFSIKTYDVTTGELRANEILFVSSDEIDLYDHKTKSEPKVSYDELLKLGYAQSDEKARFKAKDYVRWYMDKIFPFNVAVKSVEDGGKLSSCKVLVDGGSDIGINKDGHYVIYTLQDYTSNGQTIKRKNNLAYAWNIKNLEATSAEMMVLVGKKAVLKAFQDGEKLYCTRSNGGLDVNPKQIITVAISPFALKDTINQANLGWLEEFVTNSVVAHGRLKVVERKNINSINQEREIQKTEAFMDAEVIEQGKSLGADYMILGEAYSFRTWYHKQTKELEPKTGYYTNLKVGIKLINVANGKVEADQVISVTQFGGIGFYDNSTASRSQQTALNAMQARVNRMMLQTFPLELEIVEITDTSKKGAAQRVIINGGSAFGLHMPVTSSSMHALGGTPFEVFEITQEEVDGQIYERTVEIGEIALKDVENDLISECKVRKGGDLIQKNFNEGKKMVCRIKATVLAD